MNPRPRWRIALLNWLARLAYWEAEKLEALSRLLRHCPDCGENLYYGKSCTDAPRYPE